MIRFLQKPGPVKKIILGGILVVICVMMIITLVPGGLFGDYLGGGLTTQGVLAKVGDQEVTVPQVAQQARMIGKQQLSGQRPSPAHALSDAARGTKHDYLQGDRLSKPTAWGWRSVTRNCADYLHQGQLGQLLFPNGNFIGQQAYEQFIENQFNMSVQRSSSRKLRRRSRSRSCLQLSAGPSPSATRKSPTQLQSQDTKIKFDYAILTLDDVKKQINPTDAELKAFYDQNKQMYVNSIPEKIDAKYILIDTKKLAETITITPAELQKYYSQHQDDYRLPETVTVRHILIKTPTPDANGKVDQKAVDAARAKADDIAEAVAGWRKLCRSREEVFGRSGQRQGRRPVASDHPRPHCTGVRTSCFQHARGPDHRRHSHQLWLPHYSRGGKAAGPAEASGRSKGRNRTDSEAAKGGGAVAECRQHSSDIGPHRGHG